MSGKVKLATLSETARNRGNDFFKQKNYDEAIFEYNKAILFAPPESEAMGLALGNRSAVLFNMKHFQDCVTDVKRALSFCGSKSEPKRRMKLEKRLSDADENVNRMEPSQDFDEVPDLFEGSSNSVREMSSAVSVQLLENQGRCLVAEKTILPGSVVIVEEAFADTLLPHSFEQNCYYCIKKLPKCWIPCEACTYPPIMFCSESCRDAARSSHQVECGQIEDLVNSGISHLALKALLALGDHIEQFDSFNVSKEGRKWDPTNSEEFKFEQIYSLESHQNEICPDSQKLYNMAAESLVGLLSQKLKTNEVPPAIEAELVGGDPTRLCRVVVRLIQKLICNAHAITTCEPENEENRSLLSETPLSNVTKPSKGSVEERTCQKIASALYPVASLMNHSCFPNIFSSFVAGNILVIRTTKTIKKGQQLLNCYGPKVGRMMTAERKEALNMQYFFECNCTEGCASKAVSEMEGCLNGYQCRKCPYPAYFNGRKTIKCSKCGHERQFLQTDRLPSIRDMDISDYQDGLANAERTFHKYNLGLHEFKNEIAKNMAELGRYKEARELLRSCIEFVKKLHGRKSIEAGEEMVKYISLIEIDKNPIENVAYAEDLRTEAIEIFTTHYGPKFETVRNLNCTQIC